MKEDTKRKIFAGVIALLLMTGLFFGGYRAGAAGGTSGTGAGSSSDPLITQSYLDSRLEDFDGGSASFTKVSAAKGETLTVAEGSTFFMYSGAGSVSEGSFVNLSGGEVFTRGNTMVMYSLFCAAGGTASVKVSSDAVFYLQGTYTVE